MSDETETWRRRRISGSNFGSGGLGTRYFALAPGCPDHGHAIRHCDCRAFKTPAEVDAYIRDRLREDATGESR